MQEGSTLEGACFSGGCGFAGFASIYVDVQVSASPYETGFELNGYTNTGDWFQSMVGENWCATGFEVMNEVFDHAGSSVSGPCVASSLSISAGDVIQLGLNVSSSGATAGEVCFTATDLSSGRAGYSNCVAQPDGGGTPSANYFQLGSGSGFFTGPMTEIVDPSAGSCQSYLSMPVVQYRFVAGAYIVRFAPWSDEWDPATDAICYSTTSATPWTVSPGDSAYQVVDASAASSYGPHWEAARNTSSLSTTTWWEFTTDTVLPTPVATPGTLTAGDLSPVQFSEPVEVEHLDSNPTYASWTAGSPVLGACVASNADESFTCTPSGNPGTEPIQYTLGETGGYSLTSLTLSYVVTPGPSARPPAPSVPTLDLGASVTFTAEVANGSGGGTYAWSTPPGLGCPVTTASALTCTPVTAGNYTVSYLWTDSAGTPAAGNTSLRFVVHPDPAQSDPTTSRPSADVDQRVTFTATVSGGSGGGSYSWSPGLLSGCGASNGSSMVCTPADPGTFLVSYNWTDSLGREATGVASVRFTVYPLPRALPPTASRPGADVGEPVSFGSTLVGPGSGSNGYTWAVQPVAGLGCPSSVTLSVSCTPTIAGVYVVTLTVTDSNGGSTGANASFSVAPAVVVSGFVAAPAHLALGSTTILGVVASGGRGPLAYRYDNLPPGCSSADLASLLCTPTADGTFTVRLTVSDANGFLAEANATVSVGTTSSGAPPLEEYALVLAGVVGGIGAVAVFALRRTRGPRSPP
jgi:hypothetical protein